jgi:hypothetical protein
MLLALAFLQSLCTTSVNARDLFDSGPYGSFCTVPQGTELVELEQPFRVRVIQGVIRDPGGSPLPETVFEIREDSSGKAWRAVADKHGRFRIPGISRGTFTFKATRNGFQSVTGKIRVSAKARRGRIIELILPLGV